MGYPLAIVVVVLFLFISGIRARAQYERGVVFRLRPLTG